MSGVNSFETVSQTMARTGRAAALGGRAQVSGLVGPRPVLATELAMYYGAAAEHYFSVRPGITGLWQVSGRSNTSYAERVALDVAYATQPSLLQDVRILVRTPMVVLKRRGAY